MAVFALGSQIILEIHGFFLANVNTTNGDFGKMEHY